MSVIALRCSYRYSGYTPEEIERLRADLADAAVLQTRPEGIPEAGGISEMMVVAQYLGKLAVEIEPLDADVAVTAAALRARHRSLKLPDALVIATAIHLDADHLVTTDRRWPSRSRLGLRGRITEIRASS